MYYIYLILYLCVGLSFSQAQTYKFSYQVKMLINKDNNNTIEGDSTLKFLADFINLRLRYDCQANKSYLKMLAEQEWSLIPVKNDPTQENENILDLKNELIFFVKSKTIQKNNVYTLKNIKDSLCTIEGVSEKNEVILDKSLPSFITPCIQFKNNLYGVKYIKTSDFIIELLPNSVQQVSENINYSKFFKIKSNKNKLETFYFLSID